MNSVQLPVSNFMKNTKHFYNIWHFLSLRYFEICITNKFLFIHFQVKRRVAQDLLPQQEENLENKPKFLNKLFGI